MAFLKFKAERIFDGYGFTDGKVLITDEEGTVLDLVQENEAGEQLLELPGILSPGFINCHCHLELSHMKGRIAEGGGLVGFVFDVVTQRHSDEETILSAIEKAEDEMLEAGIVATGDICNNTLTIPQKNKGRIYYHNFIEASGFDPSIATQRFERASEIFREYAKYYSVPAESNSIVPHAPYSVSPSLWEKIIGFPGNHLLTIHNQETEGENEWFSSKQGDFNHLFEQMKIDTSHFKAPNRSSLQSYLERFLPNQSLILVHNVHTSREDIRFSRTTPIAERISWCLCPNANWYISRQLPPLDILMEEECNIVLGTDSLASNQQLSIMAEINTLISHFPGLSFEKCLQWATSNGAKALQLDEILGSFEKGKKPGLLLITAERNIKRLL